MAKKMRTIGPIKGELFVRHAPPQWLVREAARRWQSLTPAQIDEVCAVLEQCRRRASGRAKAADRALTQAGIDRFRHALPELLWGAAWLSICMDRDAPLSPQGRRQLLLEIDAADQALTKAAKHLRRVCRDYPIPTLAALSVDGVRQVADCYVTIRAQRARLRARRAALATVKTRPHRAPATTRRGLLVALAWWWRASGWPVTLNANGSLLAVARTLIQFATGAPWAPAVNAAMARASLNIDIARDLRDPYGSKMVLAVYARRLRGLSSILRTEPWPAPPPRATKGSLTDSEFHYQS